MFTFHHQIFGRTPIDVTAARQTAETVLNDLDEKDLLPVYGGDPGVITHSHGLDEVIVIAQKDGYRVRVTNPEGGCAAMTARLETPAEEVCSVKFL